jgi:small-conductance mechanosensitive channel
MSFLNDMMFRGDPILAWITAAAVSVGATLVFLLVKRIVAVRLDSLARRTATAVDDAVVALFRKTKWWFLALVAVWIGSSALTLSDSEAVFLRRLVTVGFLVQAGVWVVSGFVFFLEQRRTMLRETDAGAATTLGALGFVGRLGVWSVILLLILDNLGVNVTALVAGLGVGGIAIALAVQNILGDLFASLSIVLDKPFVVGDFLIINEHMGAVERVGIKTTRIRSLSGEQLVFSNADLLQARIKNYGRMSERRVPFSIGITYQTPRPLIEKVPQILREAVEAQGKTRFDRAHFQRYGDFALLFETVYYVLDRDYNLYMDIQQAINLFIHRRFEEEGIEFAYPTQTLYVARDPGAEDRAGTQGGESTRGL